MQSRSLVIAGILGGIVAGVGLFALALGLVAIVGPSLSAPLMTLLVLGTVLGFVLDSIWLCVALSQLQKLDRRERDDGDGEDGWGGPRPDPARPRLPSEDIEWWGEFEQDLRDYLEERERAPVGG